MNMNLIRILNLFAIIIKISEADLRLILIKLFMGFVGWAIAKLGLLKIGIEFI